MNKSLSIIFASFMAVCGFSVISFGQSKKPFHNINARQKNQQERIYKGIRSAELTPRETVRLEREQAQTNRMERRFRKSDDGLSLRERLRLENRLNRTSYYIYRQKHDNGDMPKP